MELLQKLKYEIDLISKGEHNEEFTGVYQRLAELEQALQLQQTGVVGSYSEKDMDNAYDKGFKDAMIKYRTDL